MLQIYIWKLQRIILYLLRLPKIDLMVIQGSNLTIYLWRPVCLKMQTPSNFIEVMLLIYLILSNTPVGLGKHLTVIKNINMSAIMQYTTLAGEIETKRNSYSVHILLQNKFRSSKISQPNEKEKTWSFQNFLTFRIMDKNQSFIFLREFLTLLSYHSQKSTNLIGRIQKSI